MKALVAVLYFQLLTASRAIDNMSPTFLTFLLSIIAISNVLNYSLLTSEDNCIARQAVRFE